MFVSMRKALPRIAAVLILQCGVSLSATAQKGPESMGFFRSYFDNVLGESADSSAAKWINYPTLAYSP